MMTTSKGELLIAQILNKNNIYFQREKSFSDLKQGRLRFDFYLPAQNAIIEWDGTQHFEQVKHFQKKRQDFQRAQENDRRKNAYCLAHNIELYRIPYWEMEKIKSLPDLFKPRYRVKSIWHTDQIIQKEV